MVMWGKRAISPAKFRRHVVEERMQEKLWLKVYRLDAWRKQQQRCFYCTVSIPLPAVTADHKHARAMGGRTTKTNIAAACFECNQAKRSMSSKQFMIAMKLANRNSPLPILMANFRWRVETRTQMAESRIASAVGIRRTT